MLLDGIDTIFLLSKGLWQRQKHECATHVIASVSFCFSDNNFLNQIQSPGILDWTLVILEVPCLIVKFGGES